MVEEEVDGGSEGKGELQNGQDRVQNGALGATVTRNPKPNLQSPKTVHWQLYACRPGFFYNNGTSVST
ncbi:hypothetical protein BFJ69_g13639 [Fusarium oxysporum]|uniref:Uncharacterized protein n=1 Tax=Fusarium oxysporum TaxID=5507 RepID=A0A420MK43_FUSOX|nr:hypothetical protein BFJ69_g13639 [Fusarium oxysporum]